MSWADWLILGLVAGWFLFALLGPRRKRGGCSGSCDRCGGCGRENKHPSETITLSAKEKTEHVP